MEAKRWLLAVLLVLSGALLAPAAVEGQEVRDHFGVSAKVTETIRLRLVEEPKAVAVTADDVARGFVEVRSGHRLALYCNARSGYLLQYELEAWVASALVQGLATESQLGRREGWLWQPWKDSSWTLLDLRYRFYLAPEVQPGDYPWPLRLSALPA